MTDLQAANRCHPLLTVLATESRSAARNAHMDASAFPVQDEFIIEGLVTGADGPCTKDADWELV